MLTHRDHAMGMPEVRRLVAEHGWATLVASGPAGLVASHLPCLLDSAQDRGGSAEELVIVGHLARADPLSRCLEEGREALLAFQGPHGYISADWYGSGPFVPTWNFMAVHVYGTPHALEGDEAFAVLERTVEHFEAARDRPWQLGSAMDYARRIAVGTVAFRLRSARIEAKAKLSQDKDPEIQDRVISALRRPGSYRQPQLADEMRRARASRRT